MAAISSPLALLPLERKSILDMIQSSAVSSLGLLAPAGVTEVAASEKSIRVRVARDHPSFGKVDCIYTFARDGSTARGRAEWVNAASGKVKTAPVNPDAFLHDIEHALLAARPAVDYSSLKAPGLNGRATNQACDES